MQNLVYEVQGVGGDIFRDWVTLSSGTRSLVLACCLDPLLAGLHHHSQTVAKFLIPHTWLSDCKQV